jgi:hypothetical protein
MQVNRRNIAAVVKVTITTYYCSHSFKAFSKIVIGGKEVMERTTSPISVEGQPTKTVLARTCMDVSFIR